MEKELIKKICVYRGLLEDEISLITNSYASDILSEYYSKTLRSSKINSHTSIRCASEDPRVAYEYSQKPGCSGKIAKIEVLIWSDGSTTIKDMPGANIYRMWHMSDWLNLSAIAGTLAAKNLNYDTREVLLNNIISYGGQSTARSYARKNFMWGMNSAEVQYDYQYFLTEGEMEDIKNKKSFNLPSNRCIHYNNPNIILICNSLIIDFELYSKSNNKAWVRYTIEELQNIKANVLAKIS